MGDIVVLPQPSYAPYQPAVVKVTAVNASGAITGFVLTSGGYYSCRPPTGPTVSAAAIASVAPNVVPLVQPSVFPQDSTFHANGSPGAGQGASFAPTWGPDFGGSDADFGAWNYNPGDNLLTDMVIGQVRVMGVGTEFDPVYGGKFGVMLNTFNAVADSIVVGGGYYGILCRAGDTRINSLNAVQSMVGLMFAGGSSVECSNVVIDTSFVASIQIDTGCTDIELRGICFFPEGNSWMNGSLGPSNSGYAIIVGQKGTSAIADHINLDFTIHNCGAQAQNGGSGALFLSNVKNSNFNLRTSNQPGNEGETHVIALHTGYAGNVDAASVLVSGTVNGISTAPVTAGAGISDVTIVSGGSGYTVGSVVMVNVPGRILNASLLVTGVSGGAVTAIKALGPGLYPTAPSTTATLSTTTTNGSGSGLTVRAKDILPVGSIAGGLALRDGSLPGWIRDYGICEVYGAGAPTGVTGANKARPGSRYTDTSSGNVYVNKGTVASPSWRAITTS